MRVTVCRNEFVYSKTDVCRNHALSKNRVYLEEFIRFFRPWFFTSVFKSNLDGIALVADWGPANGVRRTVIHSACSGFASGADCLIKRGTLCSIPVKYIYDRFEVLHRFVIMR